MYPKWVYDIFEKLRCTQCSERIKTIHINGVMTEFNPNSPFSKIPKVKISMDCPKCRTNHQVVQFKPLDTILRVVEAYCSTDSEQTTGSDEHPFSLDDQDACDCATDCADQDSDAVQDEDSPLLPRDRKLLSPISDSEVKAFKRLLHRTSFKRSTKSFQTFMKRLESAK